MRYKFVFLCTALLLVVSSAIGSDSVYRMKCMIVIDPGHGGKDKGTANAKHRYEEKTLALSTGLIVQSHLKRMGYDVVMTRTNDTFVSLSKRAEIANSKKANIFVSIHYNYSAATTASGIEIFYYQDQSKSKRAVKSKSLASFVLQKMTSNSSSKSRGVKHGNFAVIRETNMPAILIEVGFLSNTAEREILLNNKMRGIVAKKIADGIHEFLLNNGVK